MESILKLLENKTLTAVFLFLISFAVYSPSLKYDFVWDDVEGIEKIFSSFHSTNIQHILIPPVDNNKKSRYYRPAVHASMVFDYKTWGPKSAFGFHLSNVIFYSLSVVAFYFMALLILREFEVQKDGVTAFLSAVIFTLHPMHVESVSWVAGRTDVLCGLFIFLAFLFHILSYKRAVFIIFTLLCFCLALLSKEIAVVFPILVIAYDLLNRKTSLRQNMYKYIFYFGALILYLYLRSRAFINIPEIAQPLTTTGAATTAQIPSSAATASPSVITEYLQIIKTLFVTYSVYIDKLALPYDLNAFIADVPTQMYIVLPALLLMCILGLIFIFALVKKQNLISFSLFWVLLTLGLSTLIAVTSIASAPIAERYLFIPSAGYCMLLAYVVMKISDRAELKRAAWVLGGTIIISYSVLTLTRQGVWANNLNLWQDTAAKTYSNALPHSNYGLALMDRGQYDTAAEEFLIALSPDMKDSPRGKSATAINLGILYINKEQYGKAEKWFHKAREFDPRYGKAYYHLGYINFIKGELTGSKKYYEEAVEYLRKTFDFYHTYGKANLLLANVYLKLGKYEPARNQARQAINSGIPDELLEEARNILKIDNTGSKNKPK